MNEKEHKIWEDRLDRLVIILGNNMQDFVNAEKGLKTNGDVLKLILSSCFTLLLNGIYSISPSSDEAKKEQAALIEAIMELIHSIGKRKNEILIRLQKENLN